MKKTLLYLGVLLIGLSFFSCSSEAKEEKQDEQFIDFFNTLLGRADRYNKFMQELEVALSDMVNYTELYKKQPDAPELRFSFSRKPSFIYTEPKNIPKFMKEEYGEMVQEYAEAFKPLETIGKMVKEYESNKTWKTPEAESERQKIIELTQETMTAYEEKKKPLFDKLNQKANDVEEKTMVDHPLKPQILRGKKILALMDETMDELSDVELDEMVPILIDYLPKIKEVHKDNPDFASGIPFSKKGNYNSFNEWIEKFVESGEDIITHIEEENDERLLDRSFRSFNESYEKAYSSYNNFAQF